MRLSHFIILVLLAFSSSSCIDPTDIIDPTNNSTFSAEINGNEFSASGILITAEYTEQAQLGTVIGLVAAELPIGGVTKALVLAIVTVDSSGISAGDIFTANSTTKRGGGEYVLSEGTSAEVKAVSSNTEVATITVTAIDYDEKLISGTFSFDASDDDDPDTIYEIRKGVFKDVSFD